MIHGHIIGIWVRHTETSTHRHHHSNAKHRDSFTHVCFHYLKTYCAKKSFRQKIKDATNAKRALILIEPILSYYTYMLSMANSLMAATATG